MKIITLTPNQVDATSFYRAWGVFPDIMKRSDITFTKLRANLFTGMGMDWGWQSNKAI